MIANPELKCSKEDRKAELPGKSSVDKKPEITALANYYRYKQAALENGFGQNKKGKYVDLEDARIYKEQYGKGKPLVLLNSE